MATAHIPLYQIKGTTLPPLELLRRIAEDTERIADLGSKLEKEGWQLDIDLNGIIGEIFLIARNDSVSTTEAQQRFDNVTSPEWCSITIK